MIVVVGDVALDITSLLRTPLRRGGDAPAAVRAMPGGSGANVAVWLARLGCQATFIGRRGDDSFGRLLDQDLADEGVVPRLITDPDRVTGVIQVLVEPDGERTMVPDRGANAFWRVDDIPELLITGADLLHVVGYVLLDTESQAGGLEAMRLARAHQVPISLDPSSHGPLLAMGSHAFWSLVGRVDVFLPNRLEAQVLTGEANAERALGLLLRHADLVAIKLDRDGCLAGQGAARFSARAASIRVANSTGAGDAFNAGFLHGRLGGRTLEAACQAGVALGTFAATLPSTR